MKRKALYIVALGMMFSSPALGMNKNAVHGNDSTCPFSAKHDPLGAKALFAKSNGKAVNIMNADEMAEMVLRTDDYASAMSKR